MKTNNIRLNFSLLTTTLTGLMLLSLTGGSALAANWTITDLGALGAEHSVVYTSEGYSINNAGQVSGRGVVLTNGFRDHRFVLWSNGTQIDLGIRITSSSVNVAPLNDAGQVAGWSEEGNGCPFLWQAGGVTWLPWLTGTTGTRVVGLNASGTVVGYNVVNGQHVSVRWDGATVSAINLAGGEVAAINDSGALAIGITTMRQRSYVLSGGSTNWVDWPGMDPVNGTTMALDLNNSGQVCGWYIANPSVDSSEHALIWQVGGGTLLPNFPINSRSAAVALNNLGHAVGWAYRAAYDAPAVLWRDGTMTNLNNLPEVLAAGWSALTARDINDHDQIVGSGYHNGLLSAFLLSPVTAPAPFSLTIIRSGTNVVVSFPTEAGFSYHLQSKVSLTDTNWNLRATIPGNGSTQFHTDAVTNAARFYRVVVP